jgi:hypothetical protein
MTNRPATRSRGWPAHLTQQREWARTDAPQDDGRHGDRREACGQAKVDATPGRHQQDDNHEGQPSDDESASRAQLVVVGNRLEGVAELCAEDPAEHNPGGEDGQHRRQQEGGEPGAKRRHCLVEDDQVRRVGDGQHERRGVRNHGADKEERKRLGFGATDGGQHGRGQHHGRGVVGQADGDDGPGGIQEEKETGGAAAGMADGGGGQPVEDALLTGEGGEQHHAEEEEIDVRALRDGVACGAQRQQAEEDEQCCAAADPPGFRPAARTPQHEREARGDDGEKKNVRERHP